MYGMAPAHGARIVQTVLEEPALYQEWRDCIAIMSRRIKDMRAGLRQRLEAIGTPGNWRWEWPRMKILYINPPQPHYLPNWNVLVRGLEQRSVCVASEGEVPLPAEVLPDLDVRCHPRLCGQGHQRGCCQRQNDPPRLRVNNSLTHFFNFDALFVPEKNCRTKILTVEFWIYLMPLSWFLLDRVPAWLEKQLAW